MFLFKRFKEQGIVSGEALVLSLNSPGLTGGRSTPPGSARPLACSPPRSASSCRTPPHSSCSGSWPRYTACSRCGPHAGPRLQKIYIYIKRWFTHTNTHCEVIWCATHFTLKTAVSESVSHQTWIQIHRHPPHRTHSWYYSPANALNHFSEMSASRQP